MILVTGANCAIGRHLTAELNRRGRPWRAVTADSGPWRLGDVPDPAAVAGATALIHLAWPRTPVADTWLRAAHARLIGAVDPTAPCVMLSSFATRKGEASSRYGRQKALVEGQFLRRGGVVRAGLVWDDGGVVGARGRMPSRLARLGLAPHLPGWGESIYFSHVTDVVAALLACADDPATMAGVGNPSKDLLSGHGGGLWEVAGPDPLELWEALGRIHRRRVRQVAIPQPIAAAVQHHAQRRRTTSPAWDAFCSLTIADPPLSTGAVVGRMPPSW